MLLFGEVPIKALFLLDRREHGLELPTLPAATDLELFLSAHKVAVIHKRTREEVAAAVFSSKDNSSSGNGPLVRCLAWLATEKHIVCTPAGLGAGLPFGSSQIPNTILLRVELQPSFFRRDDHELAANVWRLMESWLSPSTSALWQGGVASDAVLRAGGDEAEPGTAAPGGAAGAEGLGGDLPPPPADGLLRDSIFKMVLPSDWTLEEPEPPGLKATLFRYQRRALGWMRFREGVGEAPPGSVRAQAPKTDLCWKAVKLPSGQRVFYNCIDGLVSMEPIPPSAEQLERRGGILSDEMGLGKSVIAIAITLSSFPPWRATSQPSRAVAAAEPGHGHEGPDDATASPAQPLLAQKLLARMEGRSSSNSSAEQQHGDEGALRGGTLILCPPALLQQWRNELQNHAGAALRVEIYDGLQGLALMEDDRLKPAQREAELLARLASGQSVDPTYSSNTEADLVSARLTAADVVLASLDVLQRDVHYQPLQRSLRGTKRYPVPESPLTTIRWWRLILDEAQMVGPMSAAGTMVARLRAENRWCVSGTPIGARNLQDIQALLQILQHAPFSSDAAWSHIISRPLARGGAEAAQAWETLRAALQPVMWRNTKQVVSTEFQLPERSLVLTSLQFRAPELQFYSAVRDKMRAVRDEMVALSSPGGSQQHQQAGAGAGPRKRRRTLESLEEMVYQEVGQLRLACIHPQLTKHWQELGAELDLNAGGTVSMEEVMQRLVDKATFELQDAERSLCSHLNSLAIVLLRSAAEPVEGSTPKKRKAGKEPLPRADALQEAKQFLETSFRVAEKGITAADLTKEETDAMPHPPSGPGATILAWKKLQINTAKQLELIYRETGKAEEAGKMDKDVQEKMAYLREHAHNELAFAREKLQAVEARIEQARHLLALCWDAAAQQGFPDSWGEVAEVARAASAQAWVDSMFGRLASAQQEEAVELEADENYHAMLGTLVQKRFGEAEKQLHAALATLDKFVTHVKSETAVLDLQRAQARLSGGSSQQQLRGVCKLMEGSTKLLSEFRCKTILSRWFHILVEPAAETLAAEPSEELRRAREAAAGGRNYVAALAFLGLVPGCVFKLGEQGLGYYPDASPSTSRLRPEEVSQCAEQVLRALSDQAKRLGKQAGPGTAALEACAFGAVEAKLGSLRQQIALVRLLKDLHTAQSSVRLREALQDEVDTELQVAAEKPPVAQPEEALRKGAAHWKADAVALHHKVRFLSSRMEEAHHMAEPAAAAGEGSQAAAAAEGQAGAEDAGPASPAMDLIAPPEDGGALPSVEALPAMQQATEAALRSAGLECPVCLSVIEQEARLFTACGHTYCQACTTKVVASGSCAVCRLKVTRRQVMRVAVASAKQGGQSCDPDYEALGKLEVSGDWSIKVQALVRRIRYLAENAPEEKSLVFSQFPDALKLVALALAANNIQHVQLIGGKLAVRKAMREFADNDGVRVFLLSHRVGAAGLTLVRASHVFLLEPALDPSIEQQAVARVHRIGQQRPVTVTRLIIASSVEEQVLALQEAKQALFPDGGEGEVMTLDLPMAKGEGRLEAQEFQGFLDAVL